MVVTGSLKINKNMFNFQQIDNLKSPEDFLKTYGQSRYNKKIVLQWIPTDTEELFDKHMSKKDTRRQLKLAGWTKDNISYRFNNYGFRTDDDFDIKNPAPGNMFLGCSITEGTGLNIEDTWAYKINKKFRGAFYNLAQAGTGLDTQYRLIKAWGPVLKPKRAFTLGGSEPRREFFNNGKIKQVTHWTNDSIEFFRNYISDDDELMISYKRSFDAIKQVAIENNIELYTISERLHYESWEVGGNSPQARDLMHLGTAYHDYLADNLDKWIRIV